MAMTHVFHRPRRGLLHRRVWGTNEKQNMKSVLMPIKLDPRAAVGRLEATMIPVLEASVSLPKSPQFQTHSPSPAPLTKSRAGQGDKGL